MSLLQKARDLLSDPKRWTKHRFKKSTKDVDRYCALGACHEIAHQDPGFLDWSREEGYLHRAAQRKGFDHVVHLNDAPETKHKDVLEVFDLAICMRDCEENNAK